MIGSSRTEKLVNDIAFIGDSRCYYGQRDFFKSATTADTKGLVISLKGCGVGITVDATTGILEYRAIDKALRWTAPSDTAGAWVLLTQASRLTLQSGTTDKWLNLYVMSFTSLPSTDQTISISCSGSMVKYKGFNTNPSMTVQVLGNLRNNQITAIEGAGGATSSDLVELTKYYQAVAPARGGIDVIRIGTNDISNGYTSSVTIANVTQFFNSRLSIGRKLVICGEPARWGVNTSTALTAGQLATLMDINKAYKLFANANPMRCIYVDLYALSVDTAFRDGRPASGLLIDIVHDGYTGAVLFGSAITTAIKKLGLNGDLLYPTRGDVTNLFLIGYMSGVAGTIGTGASGVCPTNFTIQRASGADATVTSSILSKTVPYRTSGVSLSITGITAGNIIQLSNSAPAGITLVSAGLVVGDTINFSLDLEVVNATNITNIQSFILFNDPLAIRNEINFIPIAGGCTNMLSNGIVIPTGATTFTFYTWVTVGASSSAVINISDIEIRKVV
jgi:hypothetical protein